MVEFITRGYYFRIWDEEAKKWDYYYVSEIEKPLIYTYTFPSTAAKTKATVHNFEDLNPHKDVVDNNKVIYRYFHQCFIGVAPEGYYYIWHPYTEKMLKWHEKIEDIDEDETAYIDYERSPFDNPEFELWVTRDRYFGIEPKNMATEAKKPKVRILAAEIKAEKIYDEALLAKLEKKEIPSIPITTRKVD
ncbi:MAG: hypothetical protein AB1420_15770 [Bacillota bacterium]